MKVGLDITAYHRLKVAKPRPAHGEDYDYQTQVNIDAPTLSLTENNWPGRTAGTSAGVFDFDEEFRFRAGSYVGYNTWRDDLAKFAGFDSAKLVWDTSPSGPFVELINFSDCEGFIGPVVAAKLAKDFMDHAARAADQGWFSECYANWRKAFEMAADGGCVDFH